MSFVASLECNFYSILHRFGILITFYSWGSPGLESGSHSKKLHALGNPIFFSLILVHAQLIAIVDVISRILWTSKVWQKQKKKNNKYIFWSWQMLMNKFSRHIWTNIEWATFSGWTIGYTYSTFFPIVCIDLSSYFFSFE